jgi:hypothetical protein
MKHYQINSYAVVTFPDFPYDSDVFSISLQTVKIKCEDLMDNKIDSEAQLKIMLLGWSCCEKLKAKVVKHKDKILTLKIIPTKKWKEYLKIVPELLEDMLI